jgi:hypothetical protein
MKTSPIYPQRIEDRKVLKLIERISKQQALRGNTNHSNSIQATSAK